MSAERNALEAALDYSKNLEVELEAVEKEMHAQRRACDLLRRELRQIKDTINGVCSEKGPVFNEVCNEASMHIDPAFVSNRCKNCGAPV